MPTDEKIKKINLDSGGNIAPNSFLSPASKVEYPINAMHNVTIYGNTNIGRYTYINVNSVIYSNVSIGRFCSIARNVEIGCAFHPVNWLSTSPFLFDKTIFKNEEYINFPKEPWKGHKKTVIGNDVWIGAGVKINSGITIGDGAIIGSGSVVTKDVKPYNIVGGCPATLIKTRFSDQQITDLLELKWFELNFNILKNISFTDIDLAISQLKEIRGKMNC